MRQEPPQNGAANRGRHRSSTHTRIVRVPPESSVLVSYAIRYRTNGQRWAASTVALFGIALLAGCEASMHQVLKNSNRNMPGAGVTNHGPHGQLGKSHSANGGGAIELELSLKKQREERKKRFEDKKSARVKSKVISTKLTTKDKQAPKLLSKGPTDPGESKRKANGKQVRKSAVKGPTDSLNEGDLVSPSSSDVVSISALREKIAAAKKKLGQHTNGTKTGRKKKPRYLKTQKKLKEYLSEDLGRLDSTALAELTLPEDPFMDSSIFEAFYVAAPQGDVTHHADSGHVPSLPSVEQTHRLKEHGTGVMEVVKEVVTNGALPFSMFEKIHTVDDDTYWPAATEVSWDAVTSKLAGSHSSYLEIGDGEMAFKVAAAYGDSCTTVAVVPQRIRDHWDPEREQMSPSTYVVSFKDDDDLKNIVTNLLQNPQAHFDTLVLSNMTLLTSELLPHEFQSKLGALFTLGRGVVIIDESNPSEETNEYFDYWKDEIPRGRSAVQGSVLNPDDWQKDKPAGPIYELVQQACQSASIVACRTTKVVRPNGGQSRTTYVVEFTGWKRPLHSQVCHHVWRLLEVFGKDPDAVVNVGKPEHCRIKWTLVKPAAKTASSKNSKNLIDHDQEQTTTTSTLRAPERKWKSSIVWGHKVTGGTYSVDLKVPTGLPVHLLLTLKLEGAAADRFTRTLLERGTTKLLEPAVHGKDLNGTLTLSGERLQREECSKGHFMFTGSDWNPAQLRKVAGKTGRQLRSIADGPQAHSESDGRVPAASELRAPTSLTFPPQGQRRKLLSRIGATDRLERHYESFWDPVWDSIVASSGFNKHKECAILTYGVDEAYLGMKLARRVELGTLVMLVPLASQSQEYAKIAKLTKRMSLRKAAFAKHLSPELVFHLQTLPDLFQYQILGVEIFRSLASMSRADFLVYLGRVLSLARTSFVEVIVPKTLQLIAGLLKLGTSQKGNDADFEAGIIHHALNSVGIKSFEVQLLDESEAEDRVHRRMLRVDIREMEREVIVDCDERLQTMQVTPTSVQIQLGDHISPRLVDIVRAGRLISLQFLLALRPDDDASSTKLFKEILHLQQQDDMCPLNILMRRGKLFTSNLEAETVEHIAVHGNTAKNGTVRVQQVVAALSSGLVTPFSFMEHGSGKGNVSMAVAQKYPEDSIISLEPSGTKTKGHWEHIKANKGPYNNIICNVEPDLRLLDKLLECPEVLRYQFFGIKYITSFITNENNRNTNNLGERIGTALATGVTTFVQLPSSRAISVATSIAYPHTITPEQRKQVLGSAGVSIDGLANVEKRFVHQITKIGGEVSQSNLGQNWRQGGLAQGHNAKPSLNVSVTPQVLAPVLTDGVYPSWRILRIDVKALSLQVNHHFDYRLDGHDRKYQLHIESNTTEQWKVWLTRAKDSWKIPYDTVNSMTLIALLRMGLLSEIKDRFYEMFLRMQMFEDMAPWNIVFRGGSLEYIDYDTKDHPLTKILPFAYQIMASLMNFERTVNDFGHCNGHAKNEYGISFISHCVHSGFNGPCKESRYPVPCGDNSCRESYPACLLAMREIETAHKHNDQGFESGKVISAQLIGMGNMAVDDSSWTYDKTGKVATTGL